MIFKTIAAVKVDPLFVLCVKAIRKYTQQNGYSDILGAKSILLDRKEEWLKLAILDSSKKLFISKEFVELFHGNDFSSVRDVVARVTESGTVDEMDWILNGNGTSDNALILSHPQVILSSSVADTLLEVLASRIGDNDRISKLVLDGFPMSDRGLSSLIKKCAPFLTEVSLSQCNNITDESVNLLLNECRNLSKLSIDFTKSVALTKIQFSQDISLSLTTLNIAGCDGLNNDIVRMIIQTSHSLASVAVSGSNITKTFIRQINNKIEVI